MSLPLLLLPLLPLLPLLLLPCCCVTFAEQVMDAGGTEMLNGKEEPAMQAACDAVRALRAVAAQHDRSALHHVLISHDAPAPRALLRVQSAQAATRHGHLVITIAAA